MSDTFRALCAELVQELERYQDDFPAKTDKMAYRAMAADAVLDRARAALARWGHPTPTPIPVSERLPEPEDCDAEGFCWWFSAADPTVSTFGVAACWVLRKHEPEDDDWRTHWLPATALPLPLPPSDHL
jgi:hypothetical protein